VPKTLGAFEFGRVKGINKADIAQLLDFRWLDNHENLLMFGPPGLGKIHVSIALEMKATEQGYTVCFEKIMNLIKLLIIDEIGYTPIDRKEANLFFNLVGELYEEKSIIITSNKGFES